MWLNFIYTVQLLISDVCTKFQNSRSSSSREIFDENFHTGLRPIYVIFFEILPISFQLKNNDDMRL